MKKLVIGVDIGGINTVLGLVDRTGEVYARSSFRTAEYPFFDDYSAYVEMLVRTLRELCAAMPAGMAAWGWSEKIPQGSISNMGRNRFPLIVRE